MIKNNKYLTVFGVTLVVAFVMTLYSGLIQKPRNGKSYVDTTINGVVDTIYHYDKSYPVVSIDDKRMVLEVPSGCSKYLLAHDSLSKDSGSYRLTSYRDKGKFIECTVWGYSEEGDDAKPDGFVSRSNLKKKKRY